MANEAKLRDKLEEAIPFDVADGTGVNKGTVMKLTDARTAAPSDGDGDVLAGIIMRDKVSGDGRTSMPVMQKGIFDMNASGAISVGSPVQSAGTDNEVKVALSPSSGAQILGTALETATDNETIQIKVNVGGG